jgi:dsRNA-specific ribonuclease
MSVDRILKKYDSWLTYKAFMQCWEVAHERLPEYYVTEEQLKEFGRVIELYGMERKFGFTAGTTVQ